MLLPLWHGLRGRIVRDATLGAGGRYRGMQHGRAPATAKVGRHSTGGADQQRLTVDRKARGRRSETAPIVPEVRFADHRGGRAATTGAETGGGDAAQ